MTNTVVEVCDGPFTRTAYSCGNSSGIAPDSLLILSMIEKNQRQSKNTVKLLTDRIISVIFDHAIELFFECNLVFYRAVLMWRGTVE